MQSTRQAAEGGHVTATEEETSGSSSAAAAAKKELPPSQPASGSTSALRSHPSLNLQRRRPHIEGSLTIREPSAHRMAQLGQSRRRDGALSRATMVHGTQQPNDMWYDAENFLLDQVKEVLNKLTEGAIDDEIWGKIVIMERCRRVAKAYLRKTTVIVDGSEDEFDGKTLGFNHFDNPQRDEHTNEIRAKINDGVILKMDYQGNIKGMARGATPIICQGWRDTRNNCVSDRLVRQQGRLNNPPGDEEKAYKMFDMRRFKHALEREMHEETPDARSLLLKTCVRVALVKDGADMVRTPCWFAVVNLVALDMLKEKIPALRSLISRDPQLQNSNNNNVSATETLNAQALTQIIAAAVSQVQKGSIQSLPVSPEQIAQLASTLTLTQQQQQQQPSKAEISTINKKDRLRKSYHCSTSSLDSSGEDSAVKSEDSGKGIRAKRWEPSVKSTAAVFENNDSRQEVKLQRIQGANRPRLQDVLFTRSQSITSDYDSNREQFDSGSWSSTQSRYQGGRSTSSSVVSEPELAVLPPKESTKEAPSGAKWHRNISNSTMNSVVPGRCELMLRTPSPASAAIYQTPNMGNLHISTCNTSCYAPFALIPDSERHSICSNFNIRPNKIIVEESSNEDPDSDDLPSDAPPLPTSKAPSDEDFGDPIDLPPAPRRFIRGTARRWKCATVRGNILTINHSNQANQPNQLSPTSVSSNSNSHSPNQAANSTTSNQPAANSHNNLSANSDKFSSSDASACDFRGTTLNRPASVPANHNCSWPHSLSSSRSSHCNSHLSSITDHSACDDSTQVNPSPSPSSPSCIQFTSTPITTLSKSPDLRREEISQLCSTWDTHHQGTLTVSHQPTDPQADFSRNNSQRHDSGALQPAATAAGSASDDTATAAAICPNRKVDTSSAKILHSSRLSRASSNVKAQTERSSKAVQRQLFSECHPFLAQQQPCRELQSSNCNGSSQDQTSSDASSEFDIEEQTMV